MIRVLLLLLVTLQLIICLPAYGIDSTGKPQKVLVIHSYDPSFRVTVEEQEGIQEVFKSRASGVQLQVEYLDAKQYNDPRYLTDILDTVFRHKLAKRTYDLVLAVDNDALTFVQRHRRDLFAGLPLVFCGINDFSPAMIAGDTAVTGVSDQPSFRETIDTALSLHPGTREIVFIGSPRNETGRSVRKALDQLQPVYADKVSFSYWEDLPVEEILSRLASLPEHRLVFIYSFVKDRSGYTLPPEASIKAIHGATRAPIYSFWSFFLGKGIVGGKLVSNREQGRVGAELALQVLQGASPTSLPIKSLEANRFQFDHVELKRLGISESSLPAGSQIINRPRSFYAVNKGIFWTGAAVTVVLATISLLLARAIIARRLAESSQKESEERYKWLVDNIPLGIARIGHDFRIVMVNSTMASWFDKPAAWFAGRLCHEVFKKREMNCTICPGCNCLRTGEQSVGEGEGVRDDGSRFPVRIRAVPLIVRDGVAREFIEVVEDITLLKRGEEERQRMQEQMLHVQKLESLGVLAGGIAHDFNNILLAILGNAELARMRLAPASPARENLDRIEQASQRAADLARQMLAYSGKGKFVVELIDLQELITEMSHMLDVSISKKAVLRYTFAKDLPTVEADATQIRQIIMNLVINASEAIADQRGVVTISTGSMHCDRAYLADTWLDEQLPEGEYVYCEIADNGCGMDRETQTRIFDPFFTTKFTGRGLGMAAVLGIVRGHHGAIKLYSEPGRGTTFKVLFPSAGRSAAARTRPAPASALKQGKGSILLVDDEDAVRILAKDMLEVLGYSVLTAENGLAGLELYRERQQDIVAVIMDLTMPHMDGEEAFRELRRIRSDIRVVISSGYSEQEVCQKFLGKGVAGFIQKPYTVEVLGNTLEQALA